MSGTPIGVVDTDVGPLLAPIDPWIWPCLVETGTPSGVRLIGRKP